MRTALYLIAIVLANLTAAQWGKAATIPNAFFFIGLDLTARDHLHDAWRHSRLWPKMLTLITTGGILSYVLNHSAGRIAVASVAAFTLAALADALTYHALRDRARLLRINGSNFTSAAVDSITFPTLAFGGLDWTVTAGQFLAKMLGGFLWSLVIGARKRDVALTH